MNRRSPLSAARFYTIFLIALVPALATAADKTAAELLPESTVFYAEIAEPKTLIDLVLDHPLRAKLEAREDVRKAYDNPQYQQFKAVLGIVEAQLGAALRSTAERAIKGGIYVGIDLKSQGGVLLVKSDDPATLEKIVGVVMFLANADAANKGQENQIKTGDYRGIKAYSTKDGKFAIVGSWLVVTNKDELGKQVVDNILDAADPTRKTLAAHPQFVAARLATAAKPAFWAYGNLAAIRDIGGFPGKLAEGKAENPPAELLVGGLLSTLSKTPYATVSLYADKTSLSLHLATPLDPSWVGPARQYYFGPAGKGVAPTPLVPKQQILSLTTHRDLSALWLAAGDLFDQQTNDQLVQADSGLSGFFSGREFGREILGALESQFQVVAARQTFAAGYSEPAVKLPAFAAIFTLKEPQKLERQLKVSFQSGVAFYNLTAGQQGLPQLDMNDEKHGGGRILSAVYFTDDADNNKKPGLINYNFSPALAFIGQRVMLCSSRKLAEELVELAEAPPAATSASVPANTLLEVDIPPLRELLNDNRRHLEAQNVLEKGHTQQQAEQEIGTLLDLLSLVEQATLRLDNDDKSVRLSLGVKIADPK